MKLGESISRLFKRPENREGRLDRYWELEGLCRTETIPQTVISGLFGAPVLTSAKREYCVRR